MCGRGGGGVITQNARTDEVKIEDQNWENRETFGIYIFTYNFQLPSFYPGSKINSPQNP